MLTASWISNSAADLQRWRCCGDRNFVAVGSTWDLTNQTDKIDPAYDTGEACYKADYGSLSDHDFGE